MKRSKGDARIGKSGQGMVEYGLIIGLVAVVLIAVLVAFRGQIAGIFDSLSAGIESGMAPPVD